MDDAVICKGVAEEVACCCVYKCIVPHRIIATWSWILGICLEIKICNVKRINHHAPTLREKCRTSMRLLVWVVTL